jgi:hypothetical protein
VKAFRQDHGLELILAGAEDAAFAGDAAFSRGRSLALGPEFLRDRRGAKINAAEALAVARRADLVRHGRARRASAQLPLLAAYAVRNGLEPFDALKALTVNPAADAQARRADRIRGARARRGLVLFTGDPFAPPAG